MFSPEGREKSSPFPRLLPCAVTQNLASFTEKRNFSKRDECEFAATPPRWPALEAGRTYRICRAEILSFSTSWALLKSDSMFCVSLLWTAISSASSRSWRFVKSCSRALRRETQSGPVRNAGRGGGGGGRMMSRCLTWLKGQGGWKWASLAAFGHWVSCRWLNSRDNGRKQAIKCNYTKNTLRLDVPICIQFQWQTLVELSSSFSSSSNIGG